MSIINPIFMIGLLRPLKIEGFALNTENGRRRIPTSPVTDGGACLLSLEMAKRPNRHSSELRDLTVYLWSTV